MRNVLVDHARARTAAKRGGGVALEELHEETWVADVDLDRVTELNEALIRLEQLDERQARMVEQRYFGGLTLEEIAGAMGLSLATVKRDLRSARAWLAAELRPNDVDRELWQRARAVFDELVELEPGPRAPRGWKRPGGPIPSCARRWNAF
jgi:DNA-directed RNA polymerase specialized sigma24 family protein